MLGKISSGKDRGCFGFGDDNQRSDQVRQSMPNANANLSGIIYVWGSTSFPESPNQSLSSSHRIGPLPTKRNWDFYPAYRKWVSLTVSVGHQGRQ
ncbi:unnamed protein product [Allacma fusca]|uniref:Uncharacterized protein n=1 Tax=Allacma fusca TaxID=39272 RepID=A0A8J2JXM0_9HEXA|nr:unnamed protein product [Allacma fusca]